MGMVIDPKQYIIGAADVYYRPIGGTGLWTSVGATIDDIVFRVTQSMFNPSENFNGVLEQIRGMDYVSKQSAEAEFNMPEFAGEKLKLPILGAVVSAGSKADTAAGWATTLGAAAAEGDTEIELASAAGVAAGDMAHIGGITLALSANVDDIIDTTSAHGLAVDDEVVFTALTGGAGLTAGTVYYVIAANLAAQTFQVSATKGGAAVNFTTDITAGRVSGPTAEHRVIDALVGTTATFRDPLRFDHASGANVVEADDDGKTEITPGNTRRQPDTAYNDFALIAQSPRDYYELYLYNSISKTEQTELTFGNESMAAAAVSIGTRRDGLNLALPSWRLRVPA